MSWQVWEVDPPATSTTLERWLTFESKFEKRRLRPAPNEWETCSDDELCALLEAALPAPSARRLIG